MTNHEGKYSDPMTVDRRRTVIQVTIACRVETPDRGD
jgi:hypothetical protein